MLAGCRREAARRRRDRRISPSRDDRAPSDLAVAGLHLWAEQSYICVHACVALCPPSESVVVRHSKRLRERAGPPAQESTPLRMHEFGCQPGRRGQRPSRGRPRASTRCPARLRRRSASLSRSRSSLTPTSRNTRSTAPQSPADIRTMVSTSPVNPPTNAAHIAPATTSTAADPNARMRERGATAPRYRPKRPTATAAVRRRAGADPSGVGGTRPKVQGRCATRIP